MDKETKRKNGIYCRIWNILGVMGILFIFSLIGIGLWCIWQQYAAPRLGRDGNEESDGVSQLAIMVENTSEFFEINLAEKKDQGMSFEQVMGEKLQISGRKDAERGYFEGKIAWNGQRIYIVDFETGEYVILQEEVRSFMLGDYYISSRCNAEKEEMELLIFYCPR